jgi:hypothetical protein
MAKPNRTRKIRRHAARIIAKKQAQKLIRRRKRKEFDPTDRSQ